MSAIETAIKNWEQERITLHPPVEGAMATAALSQTGRQYSRDVVALYCATGGMGEGESDSHLWTLWSLERVVSENSHYDRAYILFADFLLGSHCYCFKYENEERSSVCVEYFGGDEPEPVASSVQEFFKVFISDPAKLGMFD